MEEFRKIEGYDNYEVSNLGNVKSLKSNILLTPINRGGYKRVSLSKDGKKFKFDVHRLVAKGFIPNPENKPFVDHIDNDRSNNDVNNLRWVSISQNSMNSKLRCDSTTDSKGISKSKKHKGLKYEVYINKDGTRYRLGFFDTLEEAKLARINKAKELFGEYINKCETI